MDCLQPIMVASFPQKALNLVLATILLSAICSGNPKRSVNEHRQLILKGTSIFLEAEVLTGFEIFHQELVGTHTIYTSTDNPSFKFTHAEDDVSPGVNVVILDPSEDQLPRKKHIIMYVLLRKRKEDIKTFTAHLVYVRKFKGETTLEWDYFLSDESKEKWSFAKAFTPEKFLSSFYGEGNSNRAVRDIMAAPGLPTKKVRKDSSSEENQKKKKKKKKEESEEEEDDKGHKKKKKHKKEESEEEEPELPPDCKEDKKPKRRKRKQPKVVYKININHIICASGGDCKPDPCLGKGKKTDEKDKTKGRSLLGISHSHSKHPMFQGFGICPKLEPPATTLEKPHVWTGEAQLFTFILQTLRVQCIPQAMLQIQDLFNRKIVTSDENFHLELNSEHRLFNLKAPGMIDWSDISGALFFKVYSNTYFEEAGKMAENEFQSLSPTKRPISSSVSILTTITMKMIRYFKWLFEPHVYKLIKILDVMLETKYADALKHKDEGNKATNLNDLIQLHALYRFISIEKIDEILTQNLNVDNAFSDFYQAELNALTAASENASPLTH